jgi:hypothetical protein
MPTSNDPAKAAIQRANLRRGNSTHRANSEIAIRPLSTVYLAELQKDYPSESERVLKLQARRLAKITLRAEYLDGRPSEILNKRTGKINPAAMDEEALTKAFLAEHDRMEQRKREAPGGQGQTLADIEAEAAADD